ncbi:MAG: ferrochelatase [Pseudomonadota bacterium]
MKKTAVVLFNLGGPDRPEAVEPFLFNLFHDPAILRLPEPFRFLLAKLIAHRRAPIAKEIYAKLGGGSPILPLTRDQAAALHSELAAREGTQEFRVFVAMRHWHPMSEAVAGEVKEWGPDDVVLLPLYPQFSTTTSGSSLAAWKRAARRARLTAPAFAICCYPIAAGFCRAVVTLLRETLAGERRARVLFSAHGLPKKIVAAGDPYEWQVNETVKAVVAELNVPGLDFAVCYQSRVGPLEWIGPSLDAEITRAAADAKPVVVVPIAFVSEHSETLVELDIQYREIASARGVPAYTRVPTVGTSPDFIRALADLVLAARAGERTMTTESGARVCPRGFRACPNRADHKSRPA